MRKLEAENAALGTYCCEISIHGTCQGRSMAYAQNQLADGNEWKSQALPSLPHGAPSAVVAVFTVKP